MVVEITARPAAHASRILKRVPLPESKGTTQIRAPAIAAMARGDREAERGVAWDDPALAIPWPVQSDKALLSDKDRALPRLADCPSWFHA